MKATLIYCIVLLVEFSVLKVDAQTTPTAPVPTATDTLKMGLKWKYAPIYVRITPFSIYTGYGKQADRVSQSIEIGKSFNVIDAGIAFGRSSLRPDSTLFLEGRVTMDVCNFGIFANEMTIGAGKLFDSQGSLMLELTYSIFAQVSTHWGIGLTTGYYDFSNEFYDSSKTFYGIMVRYGLQRTDTGGLFGLGKGHGHPGKAGGHGGHGR